MHRLAQIWRQFDGRHETLVVAQHCDRVDGIEGDVGQLCFALLEDHLLADGFIFVDGEVVDDDFTVRGDGCKYGG